MSFDVVVAADLDWGIGKENSLPWPKLKADMAHFRRVTSSAPAEKLNAIIMGRKTWASKEMDGKPLPNRLNVVVTRQGVTVPPGVIAAASLDAALMAVRGDNIDGIYLIGGAELIRNAVDHADLRYIYLTRIEGRFGCEVFIPDLDAAGFTKTEWNGAQTCEDNGVRYRIERLARPR